MDKFLRKGIEKGVDVYNLLQAACINPVEHYGLEVGLLRENDLADFIIVEDLVSFTVKKTVISGLVAAENNKALFKTSPTKPINTFKRQPIFVENLEVKRKKGKIRVILAKDGELLTGEQLIAPKVSDGKVISDVEHDILKMVVLSRYGNDPVQVGFIKNVGLKSGALASSIAHDSHNIIAVGVSDEDLAGVINCLIENKGGIVVGTKERLFSLELEVAGLMTSRNGEEVAQAYKQLNLFAHTLGTQLSSPFMTLAFMSLLVIPQLKLGTKGLFDVNTFQPVELFVNE